MPAKSIRSGIFIAGAFALSSLVCLAPAVGCGDSDDPPAPSADASTLDVAATPDVAPKADAPLTDTSPPSEASSDATSTPDAADASDAPVLTNNSVWEATSGVLPSASCAPWALIDTADPEEPALASGVLTLATSTDAENMFYRHGASTLIEPAELRIEANMRLVSGTTSTPSRSPAVVASFRYGNPLRKNILFIASGELFMLSAENTKGASATVATTDAFHTYLVVVNTTTHAIEVFRDGASVLTTTAFLETDSSAERDISFGEASSVATGVSEWKSVKHNAAVLGPCP